MLPMQCGTTRATNGVNRLRGEMDRLFGSVFGDWQTANYPAINAWEDDAALVLEMELPGLTLEQLEINLQGMELTIKGERVATTPSQGKLLRDERHVGKFQRVLRLPYEVDRDQTEAKLQHGVLTIRLPKAGAALVRRIAIQST
jgi:HSP20 family protein